MGKYDPLFRHLNSNGNSQVALSYAEIKNILSPYGIKVLSGEDIDIPDVDLTNLSCFFCF